MNIKVDKQFEKDLKKINLKSQIIAKLFSYVSILTNNKKLPIEAREHTLLGEWKTFREFHLSGDILVIYKIINDDLILIRLGSHSQIFKKM
jgi:mRNA interferase YafQ